MEKIIAKFFVDTKTKEIFHFFTISKPHIHNHKYRWLIDMLHNIDGDSAISLVMSNEEIFKTKLVYMDNWRGVWRI